MSTKSFERLYKLTVDAGQATRALNKMSKDTSGIAKGFSRIQRAAGAAFGVIGAFRGATALVSASDQINLLEGSFEALTGSGTRAAAMLQDAFSTVAETGASLKDVSSTFQRLTVGLEELGATNSQIKTVADTFIKLGRVSGTSMFDTNAALVQFSQGLASGKLQGDELRSIMERLPLITKLIQQEWNRVNETTKITRGDVKQLGRDGKLSAELITNALLNGAKLTAEQFANLTFTLEQEQNRMGAAFTRLLKSFNELTGFDDAIKDSIHGISDAIDKAAKNLSIFTTDMGKAWENSVIFRQSLVLLGGAIVMKVVPAMYAMVKAGKVLSRTNVFMAIATASAVAIPLIIANWEEVRAYFIYRLPEAFYKAKSGLLDFMSSLSYFDGLKELFNTASILASIAAKKSGDAYAAELIRLAELRGDLNDLGTIEITNVGNPNLIKDMNTEWTKLADTVRNAFDPFAKLEGLFRQIDILVADGLIGPEVGERFKQMQLDAAESGDKYLSILEEIKAATDGFAKDFTNALVDSLKTGEIKFKEFAASVLETIAKIVLNKVFEQFFSVIVGSLPGFGTQSLTASAGVSSQISQYGGSASSLQHMNVGVLSQATYGYSGGGAATSSGVTINVNNNAPVEVETTERSTSRGIEIDILIEKQVNKSIVGGGLDKSMSSAFGLRRRAF